MPHINLIYPFREKGEFGILEEQFSKLCKTLKPFQLELREFHFFRHNEECYTLWLAPEPKEEVVKLQAALLNLVPDCGDPRKRYGNFVPHLSVGQARSQTEATELLKEFQTGWQAVTFTVYEINFIWRSNLPDDVFRVSQKIKIGGV